MYTTLAVLNVQDMQLYEVMRLSPLEKQFPRIDLDSIAFVTGKPQLMMIHDGSLMLFQYG